MHNTQLRCRRCIEFSENGSRQGLARLSSSRRPFAITGARPHYAPDLPFKLEHVLLDVKVDPKAKTLEGVATQRVRAVAPGQEWLKLDQVGLAIEEAKVGGQSAEFYTEGQSLRIRLPQNGGKGPSQGESFEVAVKYRLHDPKRGLYFTGPDADHPKKRYQVWSQGQDEDSRYWFPSFDYPNQKATSEVIATVPKGFTAVSNGALLSQKEDGAWTRYHYKLGTPHVMYLVCLTVAEFSHWEDKGPGGLPVQYFVEPGREEDGKRAFSNTPKMIEVYAAKTGMPYPYEKYSQVAVQDFIFGGMENTSATTQTDLTLHDERAHLEFSSDPLVSHELAHQWFGDLLTCRDWSHGWLNEGFATFMERVWVENSPDADGGPDEAKYYGLMDLREYLAEDSGRYRRAIVSNTYLEPMDLFDAHLYQKGGLVLNLIRYVLGEDAFWRSVQAYVARHRGGSVETLDLIRAIEDTTGRNLRRLFDEWVFGAWHPDFELTYAWHEEKKVVEIVIEQKQTGGLPVSVADGAVTHLFHLPAILELTLEGGARVTHRIELGEARERVFIPASSKPLMARFDPGGSIPKTLKFPRPKEMLLYQLKNDEDCLGRIEAAKELALVADLEIIDAMGAAIASEKFWAVQAEIATRLSEIRQDRARDGLIQALGRLAKGHPKARRAVVAALGTFKDDKAAAALKAFAEKDPSYSVEADATYAWASARMRPVPQPSAKDLDEVERFLVSQLGKDAYREVIRTSALHALSELPGVGRGERPKALVALIDWSSRSRPADARGAAVLGLGRIARTAVPSERARIFDVLAQLVDEDGFRLRMALVSALKTAGGEEASFLLWKIKSHDIDPRVRRGALAATEALGAEGTSPELVGQLKSSLEKLEEEHRKLRSAFEEAKAGLGGAGAAAKA
jgi:aminopeptidase N